MSQEGLGEYQWPLLHFWGSQSHSSCSSPSMLCERTPSPAPSPWLWPAPQASDGNITSSQPLWLPSQHPCGHFAWATRSPRVLCSKYPSSSGVARPQQWSICWKSWKILHQLWSGLWSGSNNCYPGFKEAWVTNTSICPLDLLLVPIFLTLVLQGSMCLENTRDAYSSVLSFSIHSLHFQHPRCSYFVLRSCGYSLANYSLIAIGVAIVFQNFGGALHLLFSSSTLTLPFAKKCFYACMSVAMAPPFKLIDRELEATRMYMVLARLLFEDAPQLLLQAHFTIVVYRNWFVMLNLGLSVVFALLDAKDVYLHHCKSPLEQHHYVDAEMAALRASTELEVHEGEMMKRQKEPSGINSKLVD